MMNLKVHQRVRSGLNQIDKLFRHTQDAHKSGSSFAFWVVKLLIWQYWTTSLPVAWYTAPVRAVSTCRVICTPGSGLADIPTDIKYICVLFTACSSYLTLVDGDYWFMVSSDRSVFLGISKNIPHRIPFLFSTAIKYKIEFPSVYIEIM